MPHRSRAGVCIIRVEQQPTYLLIEISTKLDLHQDIGSVLPDRNVSTTDPDLALAAVWQFLAWFDDAEII
jgi:hypothetical protein